MSDSILDILFEREDLFNEGLKESSPAILGDVFSSEIMYSHSQGISETYEEIIAGQRSNFFWHGKAVRVGGGTTVFGSDLAVTVGPIDLVDYAHGAPNTLHLHQTIFWVKEADEVWRIVLRLATRVHPDEVAAPQQGDTK
jgi:hypothetical protein